MSLKPYSYDVTKYIKMLSGGKAYLPGDPTITVARARETLKRNSHIKGGRMKKRVIFTKRRTSVNRKKKPKHTPRKRKTTVKRLGRKKKNKQNTRKKTTKKRTKAPQRKKACKQTCKEPFWN